MLVNLFLSVPTLLAYDLLSRTFALQSNMTGNNMRRNTTLMIPSTRARRKASLKRCQDSGRLTAPLSVAFVGKSIRCQNMCEAAEAFSRSRAQALPGDAQPAD